MNIYIDESGSFANASATNKWNAVAALAVPESARKKLHSIVHKVKVDCGEPASLEVKLHQVSEDLYIQFLSQLQQLNVLVFCTATDAGRNTKEQVAEHQAFQVGGVLKHIDKMKFEEGRRGAELVASQLKKLSPQLYVQLVCQINLMYDVVSRSINYFAQRTPSTLRQFMWRVDQKNSERPVFEEAFEKLSPALLQSRSIEEPMIMVRGFDYSHMKQYELPDGPPDYLKQDYGIDVEDGFDIQKMIRGDIKFMDSKESIGIQAADLIASGVRRCLRKEFCNNEAIAVLLGKSMLQAQHNAPPINLVTFGTDEPLPQETAHLVRLMVKASRQMIK